MSSQFLIPLYLVGVLSLVPRVSAQEVEAPSPASDYVAVASHVLAPDATEEAQPVRSQAVAAEQRARGGAGDGRPAQAGGGRRQGDTQGAGRAERLPARRPAPARQVIRDRDDRRRTVVISPRVVYRNNPFRYAYSGSYLPSRRVFGLGFYYGPHFGNGYYRGPYDFGSRYRTDDGQVSGYGQGSDYDIGELKLQVAPRHARVFVDGDYAGTVDDFDGTFQSLKLESGSYAIRLEAQGYETMEFGVRITSRQKITYREDLRRE